MMLYSEKVASVDKGAHARGAHRHAFRGVIVLDRRQLPASSALRKTRRSARRVFEFSRSMDGSWQGRRGGRLSPANEDNDARRCFAP